MLPPDGVKNFACCNEWRSQMKHLRCNRSTPRHIGM